MNKEEKGAIIAELTEKFNENPYFYIVDAGGMSVAQVNNLRRMCYQQGIEYRVVKNTLIKKALENVQGDYTPLEDTVLRGFSGVLFSKESGKAPAKLIKDFHKKSGKDMPKLKGASIDASLFIGGENLDTLLTLKSKQELIGEIVGLLQSPAKNVISALQSGGNKLAGIIKTLSEKEGQSES